jgi:hypothetical protein
MSSIEQLATKLFNAAHLVADPRSVAAHAFAMASVPVTEHSRQGS